MGKKENHKRDLVGLLDAFSQGGDGGELMGYIVSNSSLPGRRANLELAGAFGEEIERSSRWARHLRRRLWGLCIDMARVTAEEAPVNDPREFLPFCGAIGIGTIASVSPELTGEALESLRALANDVRWRTREAVGFALQKMLAIQPQDVLPVLDEWAAEGTWLEVRAAVAALAEPGLLTDEELALSALELHQRILARVLEAQDRRAEDFKTLRKALGYTLSVVVQAIPKEGFEYLAQLAESQDRDVQWVVRQNLKKNRWAKNYAHEVASIQALLA
jgi:hypothetical protein